LRAVVIGGKSGRHRKEKQVNQCKFANGTLNNNSTATIGTKERKEKKAEQGCRRKKRTNREQAIQILQKNK